MKTWFILAAIAIAGYVLVGKLKANKTVQEAQEAPVKYVKSLQDDVHKAEAAAEKANGQVQKMNANVSELEKQMKEGSAPPAGQHPHASGTEGTNTY